MNNDLTEVLAPIVHERFRELASVNNPERLGMPDLLPWDQLSDFHRNVVRMTTRIVQTVYDQYLEQEIGFDPIEYRKGLQLICRIGQDRLAIMLRLGLETADAVEAQRRESPQQPDPDVG